MKYKTINGWTKDSMIQQIKTKNKGYRSTSNDGSCVYRATDGNQCGMGCFIPDEYYNSEMDNKHYNTSAKSILSKFPVLKSMMPLSEEGMTSLQQIHDAMSTFNVHSEIEAWINSSVED